MLGGAVCWARSRLHRAPPPVDSCQQTDKSAVLQYGGSAGPGAQSGGEFMMEWRTTLLSPPPACPLPSRAAVPYIVALREDH